MQKNNFTMVPFKTVNSHYSMENHIEVAHVLAALTDFWNSSCKTDDGSEFKKETKTTMDRLFGGCLLLAHSCVVAFNRVVDLEAYNESEGAGFYVYELLDDMSGSWYKHMESSTLPSFLFRSINKDQWYDIAENNMVPSPYDMESVVGSWALKNSIPMRAEWAKERLVPKKKVFELTLKGFYGGWEDTDHLILLVRAPSEDFISTQLSLDAYNFIEKIVETKSQTLYTAVDFNLPEDVKALEEYILNNCDETPVEVYAALAEVRKFFPEVSQMIINVHGGWCFTSDYFIAPDFEPAENLNMEIIYAAVEKVQRYPAIFCVPFKK